MEGCIIKENEAREILLTSEPALLLNPHIFQKEESFYQQEGNKLHKAEETSEQLHGQLPF